MSRKSAPKDHSWYSEQHHCAISKIDEIVLSISSLCIVGAVSATFAALLPPNITEPKGAYIWEDATVRDWIDGCI